MKFADLFLLIWRVTAYRMRNPFVTLIEAILPLFVFYQMFLLVLLVELEADRDGSIISVGKLLFQPYKLLQENSTDVLIMYYPKGEFTSKIMTDVVGKLNLEETDVLGFTSYTEMLKHYKYSGKKNTDKNLIGVKFITNNDGNEKTDELHYVLQNSLFLPDRSRYMLSRFRRFTYNFSYVNSVFVDGQVANVQAAIDKSYYEVMTSDSSTLELTVAQFPYPQITINEALLFLEVIKHGAILGYLAMSGFVCYSLVRDRATRAKEHLQFLGISGTKILFAWFLDSLIIDIPPVWVITAMLKWKMNDIAVLHQTGLPLILLFLTLWVTANITFCFALSTLFERPASAVFASTSTYLFAFFGLKYWFPLEVDASTTTKSIRMLLPNVCLDIGFNIIWRAEEHEMGKNIRHLRLNIDQDPSPESITNVFIMLLIDIVIYSFFAIYMESLYVGLEQNRKPFWFPVVNLLKTNVTNKWRAIRAERVPHNERYRHPAIIIKMSNVTKVYKNVKVLDGINLDFYKDEITTVLGHNGAGKTTILKLILGITHPTYGNVYIKDVNTKHDLRKIRPRMGVCHQRNFLMSDMTVQEHFVFYAQLRGMNNRDALQNCQYWLNQMNLAPYPTVRIHDLSEGQQRRLSLILAFAGDPEIIVLDEPSVGLDPGSRTKLWDILLGYKGTKTIIISTQRMEAAEFVADRVIMIGHGQLICSGTMDYLKTNYGSAFALHISLASTSDKEKVRNFIETIVPTANIFEDYGTTMMVTLHYDDKPEIELLIKELETNKEIGITYVSIASCALEEIFLSAGRAQSDQGFSDESYLTQRSMHLAFGGCCSRYWYKMRGLIEMRWTVRCNLAIPTLTQFLVLFLSCIWTMIAAHNFSSPPESNIVNVTYDLYGKKVVYFSSPKDNTLILDSFLNIVRHHLQPTKVENVTEALLQKASKDLNVFDEDHIFATEFVDDTHFNGKYSEAAIYGIVMAINVLTNTYMKVKGSTIRTFVSCQSLPSLRNVIRYSIAFPWCFCPYSLGVLFIISTLGYLPMSLNSSNLNKLYLMTGFTPVKYWISTFLLDFIEFATIITLIVTYMKIWKFFTWESAKILILTTIIHGMPVIPFVYHFNCINSVIFLTSALLLYSLVTGGVCFLNIYGEMTDGPTLNILAAGCPPTMFFYRIQQFGLVYIANELWSDHANETVCNSTLNVLNMSPCCKGTNRECLNYLSHYSEGRPLNIKSINAQIIITAFLLFLMIVREFQVLEHLETFFSYQYYKYTVSKGLKPFSTPYKSRRGEAIVGMHGRALETTVTTPTTPRPTNRTETLNTRVSLVSDSENLDDHRQVQQYIVGQYRVSIVQAYIQDGASMPTQPRLNGSGKSTFLQMVTGQKVISNGTIQLSVEGTQLFIHTDLTEYLSNIGYCPQTDYLFDMLTGEQHLRIMATLRGIPQSEKSGEIDFWLNALDLYEYADSLVQFYSPGNRRKLSVALAMLGLPPLIVLDEPTAGMDPYSRRKTWKAIHKIKEMADTKSTILLTSQSMLECEILSDSAAILKDGKLVCSGTVTELKEKFGQGYYLILKVKQVTVVREVESEMRMSDLSTQGLKKYIKKNFGGFLKSEELSYLYYFIKKTDDPKKQITYYFQEVQKMQKIFKIIVDYSLTQASFEEAFLSACLDD